MKRSIAVTILLAGVTGCAQDTETVTMTGTAQGPITTAQPSAGTLSQMEHDFMREAAIGNRMEVELGRLATRNAAHPDVRQFGERMVRDHSRANQQLTDLGERLGQQLPQQLEGRQRTMMDDMAELRGREFDRMYMRHMVEDHERDVAKYREMSEHAEHPDLRAYAGQTLPILEEHLQMAKDVHGRVEAGQAGPRERDDAGAPAPRGRATTRPAQRGQP